MYKTIEAEIINGKITGAEVTSLPEHARVLITLLNSYSGRARPVVGTKTSSTVELSPEAFAPMSDEELAEWGM
jgi:hypothetical protein